jgi:hypothetical protein
MPIGKCINPSQNRNFLFKCARWSKQAFVAHSAGPNGIKNPHSSYEYSQDLVAEQLPFLIDRYDSLGRFSTERQEQ